MGICWRSVSGRTEPTNRIVRSPRVTRFHGLAHIGRRHRVSVRILCGHIFLPARLATATDEGHVVNGIQRQSTAETKLLGMAVVVLPTTVRHHSASCTDIVGDMG